MIEKKQHPVDILRFNNYISLRNQNSVCTIWLINIQTNKKRRKNHIKCENKQYNSFTRESTIEIDGICAWDRESNIKSCN